MDVDFSDLQVCSTNVVMQFARVAHATNFVYCYSIMKDNRRSEYNSATPHEQKPAMQLLLFSDSMHAELNTFFPFDPYRLPRSNSYIQGVYREWSSVAIDGDDEDEESDVDADSEAEASLCGFSVLRTVARGDDTGLGQSFEGMSISPAHNMSAMSVS